MEYVFYTMAMRLDVFVLVIRLSLQMFVGINLVYNRPLTASTITLYTFTISVSFFTTICFNILLNFISEIFLKLKSTEKSSVNLLNGMHEGLLILSQITAEES